MNKSIRTTCPYCGVGCGVVASHSNNNWTIKGDRSHPANFGRLCSKGSNLVGTFGTQGRLLEPEVDNQKVDWDTALDTVANRFTKIADEHGPQAIAFYLSGQLLTEDYYVANKLAKGFIGTPHVDTNSRLCMASSVAGHKRAFGFDTVPACYEDLDVADLIVLVGSNAAWCHPVLFQRIQENRKKRGAKLVTIDVRETATTESSDLAIILKPGSDAFLFNGLLCSLDQNGAFDIDFVDQHCNGFSDAMGQAVKSASDIASVAAQCELDIDIVSQFFELFANTQKTVTCYSLGIHMSSSGTDKVNAIINCHLATGRIGKPGAGPLSLTGQPNAMGGREVGGLANQLAAHMGYEEESVKLVEKFWQASNMARRDGLKAVEMFEAMAAGDIKAVWIQSTNPAVSLTNANLVARALQRCEFVVVSESFTAADTLAYADVKLPAATWGEKDGTVTNSERCISRQRKFLPAPEHTRPDWWMVNEIAKRMGFAKGFSFNTVAEVFDEHARLSAIGNFGTRDFDIAGLCDLRPAEYDDLQPIQWPVRPDCTDGQKRLFGDGRFFTATGKANMIAVEPRAPVDEPDEQYPLRLVSGRVRDQWHTMTRSGRVAALGAHRPEPFIEVNMQDADRYNLVHGGLARVTTPLADAVFRVQVTKGQKPGRLFVPIHWSKANSSGGHIGQLFASHLDPFSGQPEGKHSPANISPVEVCFAGLVISRQPVAPQLPVFWSRMQRQDCFAHNLAFDKKPVEGWLARTAQFLGVEENELIVFEDTSREVFRAALFRDEKIQAVVFVEPGTGPLEVTHLDSWFGSEKPANMQRWMSVSPRALTPGAEQGPAVCACFAVGAKAITEAIKSGKATTAKDIGDMLGAGTNCGSCLPEINQLIEALMAEA